MSRLNSLSVFWKYVGQAGINWKKFILPGALALGAAMFEGVSLGLLAPCMDLIVQGVVDAQKESWLVSNLKEFIGATNNTKLVLVIFVLIFLSEFMKIGMRYFSRLLITFQVNRLANSLRQRVFENYLSFNKSYFDKNNRGELYQILMAHTMAATDVLHQLNGLIIQGSTLLIYFAMMWVISWWLALMTLLVFPVLHFLAGKIIRNIRSSSLEIAASRNLLGSKMNNALSSIPLVKLYAQEKAENDCFRNISDEIEAKQNWQRQKQLLLEPIRDALMLFSFALLLAMIWYAREQTGAVGLGKYVVFLIILRRSGFLFGAFTNTLAGIARVEGPLGNVDKVLEEDPKTNIMPEGERVFGHFTDKIEFKNLNFDYEADIPTLRDVKVCFVKGETTAIVGRSGSGKSTIMNLLARYYDCNPGQIEVDGIDIRKYHSSSWRKKLAIVGQEAFLFHATLRENLFYGLERNVREGELNEVLDAACLSDLINSLPEGLETKVGDKGVRLSFGERQRLSIARAFLKNPEIVILDEPTSGLDSQTESVVQDSISRLCAGRTVIVVAHRLATIQNADKVIVLEEGRVVEQGSVSELVKDEGHFQKYWQAQQLF